MTQGIGMSKVEHIDWLARGNASCFNSINFLNWPTNLKES